MLKKPVSIILFVCLALVSHNSNADEAHFFSYHLPEPPQVGTLALAVDLAALHLEQLKRTSEECAIAGAQSNFTLRDTFGPETGILTEGELKEAKSVSALVMAQLSPALFYFKFKFERLRPYVQDKSLSPCIARAPQNDRSYPSGHAAMGYAIALALSKKFPEKRDLILKQGLQIGENRVIGGVHFPSDVEAGQELAKQVFEEFQKTEK